MDITEEKYTRDALNASEQRLRLALQASNQGIYDLNVQTGAAVVSPEYASMLGYAPATFRETNEAWIERLHPEDTESVAQTYRRYIAGELSEYRVEFRQRTYSGQWKWILSRGSVVEWSADGQPLRMLGTHTDIDTRKETELALIRQMERLQRAEAHARLGSWEFVVDTNQPGWWSVEMYQLFDADPAGGVPTFDEYMSYLHPEDRPSLLETLNLMANGIEPTPAPFRSNPERGPQCWFNPSLTCERDAEGRPIKFSGTVLDITAIKNAETALRDSEERLRTLINTIPDLIWLKDPNGVYLFCNRMFERLFGAKEADITGKTDYDFVEYRLADFFRENDLKAIKAGHPSINEEWLTFNEGGYHGYFETIKTPVSGSDGQLIGVLGISRDITVIIEAQESLRQLNAGLEARVAERTAEMQSLNQSLESFVYSVSHDLKTPLRGVEGYSRLLQEDYDKQLDDEGRLFINNIRGGIQRMNELIDDLLAYSRMERRKLETSPLDLNLILSNVLAEHAHDFDARGVKIDVALPPLTVHADADGLTMVLRNLLGNALKFSSHSPQPHIEIGASQEGENVTLWVKDNGIGFDIKYHERIFEIFQRLHRLEDYPGTGIGLALVKKAMDRMNGKVWAESKLGEYAKFYLTLKS
jgi:PAS domain S-box-containing protein